MRFSTVVISFSESTYMPVPAAPRRLARNLICRADSSPDTYSTFSPAMAMLAHTCVSSVDFPTPGSPPTSTTDPSTTPPPSTRSSSPIPQGRRCAASSGISSMAAGGSARARSALDLFFRAFVLSKALFFVERVPTSAFRTAAKPTPGFITAFRADVHRFAFCHKNVLRMFACCIISQRGATCQMRDFDL